MEQAELKAIYARAQAELGRIPGVVGVGYGLKETDGETTQLPSIQVYVLEKKPIAEIPPDERIPDHFEGIPTDVMIVPDVLSTECIDKAQHSPLIGGITITNFKIDPNDATKVERGTLGFFATLDGVAGPENVVLVSNNHVLTAFGAGVGDTIYQPSWSPPGSPTTMVKDSGPVAKILNAGLKGNMKFTYPTEAELDYFVDCASAKLDICISSWCDTNCGVSYKNEIRGLAIGTPTPNSKLEGFARVTQADIDAPGDHLLFKVGSTTSKTTGKLTGVDVPGSAGQQRMIRVEVVGVDCDGIAQFNAPGDSGSALVDAQNKLVGLVHGRDTGDIKKTYACHIHPVLKRLGITPISTQNPPVGPAGKARADVRGFIHSVNETIPLRERFLATPTGAKVYAAVLAHRAEVVALVNHRRPVTVAWHRGQGPAFLANGVENVRDPAHLVPREIDGVDRATLARRMAAILTEHGSPELARAIAEWLPVVLAHVDDFDSLHDLVGRFEPEPADA